VKFADYMASNQLFAGLIKKEPVRPISLASVQAAGLLAIGPAVATLTGAALIGSLKSWNVAYEFEISQPLLNNWPWSVALLYQNPATLLLAVPQVALTPPSMVASGERYRLNFSIVAKEVAYASAS